MRMRMLSVAVTMLIAVSPRAQEAPEESPVPMLRELLRSDLATARLQAAERLGRQLAYEMGLPSHAAVPELLEVLAHDPDSSVAEMAALSLARIGPWPLGVFDFVNSKLDAWSKANAPPTVIAHMREALAAPGGEWPGTAIVPDLVALLAVPACTRDALCALAMLGPDAASARDALAQRVVDVDADVRWRAAFALAMQRADSVPALRQALDDEVPAVRLWALRAVLSGDAPPNAHAARLLSWLEDSREFVLEWALEMAQKLGRDAAPAAPRLVQLLGRYATAGRAAELLTSLGGDAAAAVPALVERLAPTNRLDGFDVQERERAAILLGAIGPRAGAATDRLLKLATAPVAQSGKDLGMQHELENQACTAIAALAKIAPDRAFAALLPGFEADGKGDYPGEWHRVGRFAALGPAATPALPRLRELLRSPNDRDREKALRVIPAIGEGAAPALPDLMPLLAHTDGRMRMFVADAITSIGPAAASAVPVFEEHFAHDPPSMRMYLIQHVRRFDSAAEPLLLKAITDDEPWIRTSAFHQLFLLPQLSDEARREITARLVGPDDELAESILHQMAQVPDLRATCSSGARQLVSRSNTGLRQACAHVLFQDVAREMPRPSWQSGWLYADFTRLVGQWNVGVRTGEEMTAFFDAAGITKWTLAFVTAEEPYTRLSAAVVLGQLPATPSTIVALRGLCQDDSATVRTASALALGNLGPTSREALPNLAKALTDPDWFVRAAAATSLRTLQVR